MKPNKFTIFLIFSAFIHVGILVIFYQYGPQLQEKPENLVPVEVMLVKDMPLVSTKSSIVSAEPKASITQPSPITTSHISTSKKIDLELLSYPSNPKIEPSQVLIHRSSPHERKTKLAPIHRMTRPEKLSSIATAVDSLPPEEDPILSIETSKSVLAVSTKRRSVPSPDLASVSPLKWQRSSQSRPDTTLGKTALMAPPVLAPDSNPIAIKVDRAPSLLFPGSAQGASFILLMDTSGSVKGNPLHGIKTSAIEFISLMGSKDRVGLMTLNDTTHLIGELTSKNDGLKYKVSGLRTAGQLTVLYDSLLEAGRLLQQEDRENLHIVLFSDGKDEGSQASLEQVITGLKQLNISVLAVGYTRVAKKYLDILRQIADGTGGVFVQTPEFRDILTLYKSVSIAQKTGTDARPANQGALLVKSDPTDTDIYVDGQYLGSTPMLIKLPMGTFNVLLRNECCYDWQALIELSEPGELPLFIRLERLVN